MTANDYQKQALRTEVTPEFISEKYIQSRVDAGTDGSLGAHQLSRLMHGLMGSSTESGESWDMVKKAIVYGRKFDKVNVLEEIGDSMWYLALALDACGYTMEQAMEANINKLLKRYPQTFSEEQAVTRDLSAEREVLEAHASDR